MDSSDITRRLELLDEGEFSFEALYSPQEWSNFSIQEKRGGGRSFYTRVSRGIFNVGGLIVEEIPSTNPQRYQKRKLSSQISNRVFLNEIPGIEQTAFSDYIKILDAAGKWLEIVDKP